MSKFREQSKIKLFIDQTFVGLLDEVLNSVSDSLAYRLKYMRTDPDVFLFDQINFLKWEEDDTISYLSSKRIERVLDAGGDVWTDSSRQSMRAGRALRKVHKEEMHSELLERTVNLIAAVSAMRRIKIQVVDGDEIAYWYSGNRYDSTTYGNALGKSCMRYDECEKYLDLYTQNPDYVRMAILVNPNTNTLLGRALLWNTDEEGWVMDRIYGSSTVEMQFIEYAKSNDMWRKTYQTFDTPREWTRPNGTETTKMLTVSMGGNKNMVYRRYPYLDTFSSLHLTENGVGRLNCHGRNKSDEVAHYLLHSTSGGPAIQTCHGCQKVCDPSSSDCDECRELYSCRACGGQRRTDGNEEHRLCRYCYNQRHCSQCDSVSDEPLNHHHIATQMRLCETCYQQMCDTVECYECGEAIGRRHSLVRVGRGIGERWEVLCNGCARGGQCQACSSYVPINERITPESVETLIQSGAYSRREIEMLRLGTRYCRHCR